MAAFFGNSDIVVGAVAEGVRRSLPLHKLSHASRDKSREKDVWG